MVLKNRLGEDCHKRARRLFKNRYRIDSIRLKHWDYTMDGYYFITICVRERRRAFGSVQNGQMVLSEIGIIAERYWREIPNHFSSVRLDEYVIMPDHIHGIIVIEKPEGEHENQEGGDVGRDGKLEKLEKSERDKAMPCLTGDIGITGITGIEGTNDTTDTVKFNVGNVCRAKIDSYKARFQDQGKGSISAVIGSFKSICTRTINRSQKEIFFAWQPGFWDRVIRTSTDLRRIRNYIRKNPMNWGKRKVK